MFEEKGDIVKRRIIAAAALALAVPFVATGQPPEPKTGSRRPAIRMMEAVLSRAVLTGAETLAGQIAGSSPSVSFFTGQAKAHGFILDGYGIFFHVEIPEMQQSLVYSVTTLERDLALANALDTLARVVETAPEGSSKLQAEQAIRRLQLQVPPASPAAASTPAAAAPRGAIRSADVPAGLEAADAPARMPVAPVPEHVLRDPTGAYRDAIKNALIDAMLEHSRGMRLGPDEWLSVAAHRGENPMTPNEIVTSSTLVLRIKGRDLALYEADPARRDEVRARVEVRAF